MVILVKVNEEDAGVCVIYTLISSKPDKFAAVMKEWPRKL